MLAFFRRYEKTFLLVIFAPALLSLGITGAVLQVLNDPTEQTVGTVFGESVSLTEFERVAGPYRRVNTYADDDMVWKFFTLYKAAQRAGLSVSDEEVGERIASQKRFEIAQHVARKQLEAEGVFEGSPQFRQRMSQILIKTLTEETPKFDRELYREVIPKGMTVREYEEHEKREALVGRYLDTLREMATVTPDAVWKEYQDQHHRRAAELAVLDASAHVPDVAVVDSSDPRVVSDEQVQAYFESHEQDYEEPRRVKLEAVGVALDDLAVAEPSVEDAQAYFDARRSDIAGVTSQTAWPDLTDEQREQVFDMLEGERRLARADEVMQAVADRVATTAEGAPDLAAIAKEVAEATGAKVQHVVTDLVDRDAVVAHPLIGSTAAKVWFGVDHAPGDVSDVLAGAEGWFVLRALETKHARMPTFDEVKDKVRTDYATGSRAERRRHYDEHKATKYLGERAWKVEALVVDDATYGEGDAASEKAKKALQTFLDHASSEEAKTRKPISFTTVYGLDAVEKAGAIEHLKAEKALTRSELDQDPVLGGVADVVGSFEPNTLPLQPYRRKDGKGWVVFRVAQRVTPEVQPFEAVEEQIARELAKERSVDRARAWAERLSADLQGASPDEAKATLEEKGLQVQRTEPFGRDATSLEGFPDAGRIVAAAFEAEVKVGGPFARVIELPTHPDGPRVVLMRVAEKVDAPQEEFAKQYSKLRQDVLRRVKGEYATAQTRRTFLEAKGIDDEHLKYVTALRDGPGGQTRLRLRQIFLPPDRSIVDAWLKEKAMERIREAQAELSQGKSWEALVDKHSEDEVTRVRKGELPAVQRGQLVEDFGVDFEEAVFDLREGQVSQPIESPRGIHLVKRLGQRDGRTTFSHLLIKTDPETRKLPQEIREKAEQATKARVEEAQRRLAAGATFGDVAQATGDAKDPNGQGQVFEMDYVTPFERAAFEQPIEWETKEGSADREDPTWLPGPVELPTGANGATEWHLFACARDAYDRGMGDAAVRRDRQVFHIVTPSKDAIERAHARLRDWLKERFEEDEDRPSWSQILEEFKTVAREASRAPDAKKGGAVGLLQLEGDVRAYGPAFYDAASRKPDGTPVTAGYRTGVFRSEQGYHIVEVVEVVQAGDDRADTVADQLLRGTDWK